MESFENSLRIFSDLAKTITGTLSLKMTIAESCFAVLDCLRCPNLASVSNHDSNVSHNSTFLLEPSECVD